MKTTLQYQSVWITFSDGKRAGFSGQAAVFPGDERKIVDISFTPPRELPAGYSFDVVPIETPRAEH